MTRNMRYAAIAGAVVVLAVVLLIADKALYAGGLVLAGLALIGADHMFTDDTAETTDPKDRTRESGPGVGGRSRIPPTA